MSSGPVLWHQMSVKNTGHKYIVRQNIWCWHSHCTVHFDRQQTLSYTPTPGEYPPHTTCIPHIPSQFTSTTQHRHYFTEFYEQLATSTLSHRSDTARTIETSLLLQLYCVFKNGRPITQEPNFAETNLGNIIFKMFTFRRRKASLRTVLSSCKNTHFDPSVVGDDDRNIGGQSNNITFLELFPSRHDGKQFPLVEFYGINLCSTSHAQVQIIIF